MKTYTFKIKVDCEKVVIACHMQFEQFYDSVKMSHMDDLVARYPNVYVTASDYSFSDEDGEHFIFIDHALSTLKTLLDSKDLKAYLLSEGFCGFVGDSDWNHSLSNDIKHSADDFIKHEKEILEKGDDENVGDDTAEKE